MTVFSVTSKKARPKASAAAGGVITAYDLKNGQGGRVVAVRTGGGAKARLNSLGITEGSIITLIGVSLFKSSVLLAQSAVRVGVRKALAMSIEVQPCV